MDIKNLTAVHVLLLLVTLPNIHRLKKFIHRLSNRPKPFLTWLTVCFADITVSQGGSAATCARCGRIFNIHLDYKLTRESSSENFFNQLRFDRIVAMSLWPTILAHPASYRRNITSSGRSRVPKRKMAFLIDCLEAKPNVYQRTKEMIIKQVRGLSSRVLRPMFTRPVIYTHNG